jgi:cell division protein FtsL
MQEAARRAGQARARGSLRQGRNESVVVAVVTIIVVVVIVIVTVALRIAALEVRRRIDAAGADIGKWET